MSTKPIRKTDALYCAKCDKYLFGQKYQEHDGQPYCQKCYDNLFVAETEEPHIVPLEGHLVVTEDGSFSLKRGDDGSEWYTDGKTTIRKDVFEGRYREDNVPIGVSATTVRNDEVNVPLELQRKLLRSTFYDTACWLVELLDDEDFVDDLEEMALARLTEAHPRWGSTMYGWDDTRRFRAIMEELADVFVYKSSES